MKRFTKSSLSFVESKMITGQGNTLIIVVQLIVMMDWETCTWQF
jgi:hypothetical protein